ncbi:MAG: alpha amylase C-terminal domain-containing protein, partial [Anaerolineales bacterium]|nr:alpha amylase C-terminal domain-containing protein [Anaerolineales bacterium]
TPTITPTPDPNAPDRTVMVHLFEWKWSDIAQECENFLGPKGFAAVQVSPPMEHRVIEGMNYPWWQRYQAVSYLIQSRSGTRAEFDDMVARCAAAGVDVYVDAVINHMSGLNPNECDTGSAGTPICEAGNVATYPTDPGQYSLQDFHMDPTSSHTCNHNISNWGDAYEVESCELLGLDDLDTSESYVQNEIAGYLNDLVGNLGVAGFRIDAAKHINTNELHTILNLINGSPYIFQEVIQDGLTDGGNYLQNGDVTEFRYTQEIANRFRFGPIEALQGLENWWLPDSGAVVFVDNHDNQRHGSNIITYKDGDLYQIANVFMLAYPYGSPKLMSSYYFTNPDAGPPTNGGGDTKSVYDGGGNPTGCNQADWVCEHRQTGIANMVGFRNYTKDSYYVSDWWDNGYDQIAFGRGGDGFVVINRSENALSQTFQTSMPAGQYCDVVHGELTPDGTSCTGPIIAVDSAGQIVDLSVSGIDAVAIHGGAKIGAITPTPTPTLGALPDLLPIAMSIELENPGCFIPGDNLGVRVWVQNNGAAAAPAFVVDVNGAQQTVAGGLAVGASTSLFFPGYNTFPDPNVAVADATFLVPESNENNNTLSQVLPVPTPPVPCTPTPTPQPTPTVVDDVSYTIQYDGWSGGQAAGAWGGGYRATSTQNQWLAYRTTQPASSVTLLVCQGPDLGIAFPLIDGAFQGILDLYAPTPACNVPVTYNGLSNSLHTIVFVASGQKNPASSGLAVRFDGLQVGGNTIDDKNPGVIYKGWSGLALGAAYNGSTRLSATPNAAVQFTISGSQFTWITTKCAMCGQAAVLVDGAPVAQVDNYSPNWQFQAAQVISGLSNGTHTIQIVALGTHNPNATGSLIFFDGYSIP